ncbi:YveK family protein [Paenibacillaceae bacterium WGS1546]|uniref:YveK family protein n=1 Tax=Cohnella sp. WGS1546 TaxID=3366810 RepID=UPI00372D1359
MEPEIKEYLRMLLKRWWIVFGIWLIACGSTAAYHYLYAKPVYEAGIKLIVNTTNQVDGLMRPDSNLITSNIMMIDTYKEIIASSAIMQKVSDRHPDLRLTTDELIRKTKVGSSSRSQVMSITYRDESSSRAVQLVNEIGLVFRSEIPKIMNVDNVTILSEARQPSNPEPVSPGLAFKLALASVVSLILAVGFILLKEFLDDTVKSERDVMVHLGKPTLAEIAKIKRKDLKSAIGQPAGSASLSGDPLSVRINQQL